MMIKQVWKQFQLSQRGKRMRKHHLRLDKTLMFTLYLATKVGRVLIARL